MQQAHHWGILQSIKKLGKVQKNRKPRKIVARTKEYQHFLSFRQNTKKS